VTVAGARGRVAHVVLSFGELSQTFVRDAVWELDRLGWEAWVLAHDVHNRDLFPFPPDERLLRLEPGRGRRRVADRLRGRPWTEHVLDFERPLRELRPALVHAHLGRAILYAAPAALRLGIPFLPAFHGWDLTVMPDEEPWPRAYRWLFERVPRVVTVSRFLERRLRELGYAGRIDIIPAGVRVADIPYREPRTGAGGELRLLFVGRVVPYKGLDVLLRALPRVVAEQPGTVLEVVGDGPDLAACRELARELGVERRVELRGGQPPAAVFDAMARADVLVAPSRDTGTGQAEGSPVVTKEALAIGVQVVTTTNGGLPETIPPELQGELVAQGDAGALAERILAVAAARAAWPERARSARAWVEREFDWRALARRTEAVYEELVAAAPGAGRADATS
jgi:colanic acid/amylovoran biosynthesis glycosyltransferase